MAGTSQKPSQRPLGPPERLRRSEKVSRGSQQLSKAASTPPGTAKSSGEARRFPTVAGTSQKPSQRPLGPLKRLRRSKKGFCRSRQLSKAVSTPPGAAGTAQEKREGFPR